MTLSCWMLNLTLAGAVATSPARGRSRIGLSFCLANALSCPAIHVFNAGPRLVRAVASDFSIAASFCL